MTRTGFASFSHSSLMWPSSPQLKQYCGLGLWFLPVWSAISFANLSNFCFYYKLFRIGDLFICCVAVIVPNWLWISDTCLVSSCVSVCQAEHTLHVQKVLQRLLENELFMKAKKIPILCSLHKFPGVHYWEWASEDRSRKDPGSGRVAQTHNNKTASAIHGLCQLLLSFHLRL